MKALIFTCKGAVRVLTRVSFFHRFHRGKSDLCHRLLQEHFSTLGDLFEAITSKAPPQIIYALSSHHGGQWSQGKLVQSRRDIFSLFILANYLNAQTGQSGKSDFSILSIDGSEMKEKYALRSICVVCAKY